MIPMPTLNRPRPPRNFHVLTKPIGALCNLDCTYCYYLHKEHLLAASGGERISNEALEEFIKQYISGQDGDRVVFTWHGGEPTLMGLDFFRRVAALQERHAAGKRVENDLQTNGLLLDEAWCAFLRDHRFRVGLSIDGPEELHDRFRVTKGGRPTFREVRAAARRLHDHGVRFNALTVVNRVNARHPAEVYHFLTQELGVTLVQWLPCVEPNDFCTTAPGKWDAAAMPALGSPAARPGNPDSVVTDWSVDPDDWGEFLCRTFDLWYRNDLGRVAVTWFESWVAQWMGQPATMCVLAEVCGRALALEKDGSLYSCDHFVYPEYRLGNILTEPRSLLDMVYSPEQRKFGCDKRDALPDYCRECRYRFACNGECPKNRFLKTPAGQPGLNYLCAGFKRFLEYADPYFRNIVKQIYFETSGQLGLSPDDPAPDRRP
jgi:uncharacterized protein